jgi:2-keto-4-pentenoate hydratase/2-oxohepta-3-ene-1,7-dioic acid hydratase in catechol pathway
MRLVRTGPHGQERPGAVDADGVIRDVSAWVSDWTGTALHPEFLREFGARLRAEAAGLPIVDVDTVRVGPPVRPGGHLLSIGLNYGSHVAEVDMSIPQEPVVSSKAPSTMVGPFDDLIIPPGGDKTDWEVELAIVIGRRAQYLPDTLSAVGCIAGFCTSNDVSERSWLLDRGGQWVKGKSFESFSPLGPYLVTPDEVDDPQSLRLTCYVNGQQMQDANTADMIFDIPYLVWYISQFLVLQPGDVIFTGTPGGSAIGRSDQPYLRPGDSIEVDVDGLGTQHQQCRAFGVAAGGSSGNRPAVSIEEGVA